MKNVAIISLLWVLSLTAAANKPNFTGAWTLDKNKSFSNPPGFDQNMIVTHAGDQIKIEGKITTARGDFPINESYPLDGTPVDFTPPNPPNAKGKRKASWLPNHRGILVEDEVTADSPNGPVTSQTTRKWLLAPDGNTLTIDYYFDGGGRSGESKRVFVKKAQ